MVLRAYADPKTAHISPYSVVRTHFAIQRGTLSVRGAVRTSIFPQTGSSPGEALRESGPQPRRTPTYPPHPNTPQSTFLPLRPFSLIALHPHPPRLSMYLFDRRPGIGGRLQTPHCASPSWTMSLSTRDTSVARYPSPVPRLCQAHSLLGRMASQRGCVCACTFIIIVVQ